MIAAARGHKSATDWLLQHGVVVNAALNESNTTALHFVSGNDSCDDAAMIELLLANGADVHKRSSNGRTALVTAASTGKLECVKQLIAAGADVMSADDIGFTSLSIAAATQCSAIVQLLTQHGATAVIDHVIHMACPGAYDCDCSSVTALMMCNATDTVQLLLAAGADVHLATNEGDTCLHKAAKHNYIIPVICLLIKAGADLHAVNNDGKTAIQIAHDKGRTFMHQLLNRAAAQQQCVSSSCGL
eukprot:12935-Heterococcus_DN1.PRE.1